MKLSDKKPWKSPKTIGAISLNIGSCERPLIKGLPFTFTWAADELYVTVSSSRLRVYRVDISTIASIGTAPALARKGIIGSDGTIKEESFVMTSEKIIFLPHSARNRKVQFIPPTEPGKMTLVVIGPRLGSKNAPSIALYLNGDDLGGWISVKDKESAEGELFDRHQGLKGMHEDFDAQEDCDIIPVAEYNR
ncbi:hypothetical protein ABW19_dt0209918 [Dactylella cylindrospora]|nr:hypothetical protein ABW19_dt0209918 [Dactylella cylindrospora]